MTYLALVAGVVGVGAMGGCDGPPARARSWRHTERHTPGAVGEAVAEAATATDDRSDETAGEAAGRKALRIHLPVEPATLDPLVDPDRAMLEVTEDTVFETLLRHSAAGYVPELAETFRVTGGGNEIRFALRAGVTFHDGHPFTAEDARFAIDAARRAASRNGRLRAALADVVSVEAWGPRDLRVVLRRPTGYALRALAEVPMVPSSLYATEANRVQRARNPVGTGPYRLARWAKGERLVLERFPGYWGKAPAIERVEFLVVPDGARALTLTKQGKIDILPALIPEHWPAEADTPDVRADFAPLELAPARFVAGVFNLRRPPFDDPRVRRAAILLVDRWRLARDAWRGLARPSTGPVWPGGPGDAEAPDPPPFDPLWAGRLLGEAGWTVDKDGLRAQNGKRLKITLVAAGATSSGEPDRDVLVTSLRRGGFQVELRVIGAEDYVQRLRAGDFDLATIDYRGRTDEDLAPFFATGGARNLGGLSIHDVDESLAAAAEPWEPAARAPRVGELGRLVAAEAPLLPLVRATPHGLVAKRVRGVVVHDGWFAIRDLSFTE